MKTVSISLMALSLFLIMNGEGKTKALMSCLKSININECTTHCKEDDFTKGSITSNDPNCKPFGGGHVHGCYCE